MAPVPKFDVTFAIKEGRILVQQTPSIPSFRPSLHSTFSGYVPVTQSQSGFDVCGRQGIRFPHLTQSERRNETAGIIGVTLGVPSLSAAAIESEECLLCK